MSIETIPFPAVTICPEIKCKKEIFDFTKNVVEKIMSEASLLSGLTDDEYTNVTLKLHLIQ